MFTFWSWAPPYLFTFWSWAPPYLFTFGTFWIIVAGHLYFWSKKSRELAENCVWGFSRAPRILTLICSRVGDAQGIECHLIVRTINVLLYCPLMCCLKVEHSIVMMLANLKHYLAVALRHCCELFLLVQYDSQFTECLLLDLGSILAEIQGVSKNFWHFAYSLSPTQQFVVRKWPIIWLLFTNNKRIMQEYMVQGVH